MANVALAMYGHPIESYLPLARHAEHLGFAGLWVGEHLVALDEFASVDPHRPNSGPMVSPDTELYDIWVLCGALLAATTDLYIATGVYIAPLRHPLITSLASLTAVKIGGERFKLGIGAGWMPEEFAALGQDFKTRFRRLEESIDVVRLTSAGGSSAHEGEHYKYPSLRLTHESTHVPIIMGGVVDGALQRAARFADGWYNPGLTDLDECLAIRRRIEELRDQAGATNQFDYYIRMMAVMGPVEVERYEAAGFDNIIVPWESLWSSAERIRLPLSEKFARLDEMAERIGLKVAS